MPRQRRAGFDTSCWQWSSVKSNGSNIISGAANELRNHAKKNPRCVLLKPAIAEIWNRFAQDLDAMAIRFVSDAEAAHATASSSSSSPASSEGTVQEELIRHGGARVRVPNPNKGGGRKANKIKITVRPRRNPRPSLNV